MHFQFEQRIGGSPDAVAAAFADPAYYASLGELPKLGGAEVLRHGLEGDVVTLEIRYRFTGDLSSAVRAVIDPAKLTWVEHSTHDLATLQVHYELRPDHYHDRLQCQGGYRFQADGEATLRRDEGDLKVRVALVGSRVEGAIVSGLREHLAAEAALVERFLD
ncbi:MAG: DUF2505 family protein [Acidimicrobiales bacterium]